MAGAFQLGMTGSAADGTVGCCGGGNSPPGVASPCLCPSTPTTWNMAVNLGSNDPRDYFYLQNTSLTYGGPRPGTTTGDPFWISPQLTGVNKLGQAVNFSVYFVCTTQTGGQTTYQGLFRLVIYNRDTANSDEVVGAFGNPKSCSPFLLVPTVNSVHTGAQSFYAQGGSVAVTG